MDSQDKMEISVAFLTWKEPGIINVHFKSDSTITPLEQDELLNAVLLFAGDKPHCVLYTAGEFVSFAPETRKRSAELEKLTKHIASASVAHNLAYTIIANFYIRFNKPKKPFKSFTNAEDAQEWLRNFLSK